jgi:hypothetical protein
MINGTTMGFFLKSTEVKKMSVKPEPLSIRDYLIGFLVVLPLTVGLAYLCGRIDGVEKSGWIW